MNATIFDWLAPVRWRCLRCWQWFTTRELVPTCTFCGFRETPS